MYLYKTKIRFQHVDIAGVMFYAHLFTIMHEAFEEWLEQSGIPLKKIIEDHRWVLPVIHAEADYKIPLLLGEEVRIRIDIERIETSSFSLNYAVEKCASKVVAAQGRTIHVCVHPGNNKKLPLVKRLHKALLELK